MGYDIAHNWLPNEVELVRRNLKESSGKVYGVRFVLNSDRTKKIFSPPQEPTIALETVEPTYDSHTVTFWTKPEDIDILQALFNHAINALDAAFEQAYPG